MNATALDRPWNFPILNRKLIQPGIHRTEGPFRQPFIQGWLIRQNSCRKRLGWESPDRTDLNKTHTIEILQLGNCIWSYLIINSSTRNPSKRQLDPGILEKRNKLKPHWWDTNPRHRDTSAWNVNLIISEYKHFGEKPFHQATCSGSQCSAAGPGRLLSHRLSKSPIQER